MFCSVDCQNYMALISQSCVVFVTKNAEFISIGVAYKTLSSELRIFGNKYYTTLANQHQTPNTPVTSQPQLSLLSLKIFALAL